MRIRTLLGIGTVLLGTAGAFAARPHKEVRMQEPAHIVQPVQEYRNIPREHEDRDRGEFERHDFDRREVSRFNYRDDHRDRDGRWNVRVAPIVIAPDCR